MASEPFADNAAHRGFRTRRRIRLTLAALRGGVT